MTKPLMVDLFAGLGGWAEGGLAEGYAVIGFDIERHDYGTGGYPSQLVLQDVMTLHGSQFKDAALIVASPPCQAYSYRAMPWRRARALPPPDNSLFYACFRIRREAIEAAGHFIPLVVENVRGAQKWVGRSRWNYGSYHLWGDVPALMPITPRAHKFNPDGGSWFAISNSKNRGAQGIKNHNCKTWYPPSDPRHQPNQRFNRLEGVKSSQSGQAWFDETPRDKMLGEKGPAAFGSKSNARKAASAAIAKIPFPLAVHIARYWKPRD